jgi:uncharacterized protein (DUF1778 family)
MTTKKLSRIIRSIRMTTAEKTLIQRGANRAARGNFNLFLVNAGLEAAGAVIAAEKEAKEKSRAPQIEVEA